MNTDLGNEIYNNFFNDVGVLIVRNAYDNNVIDRYDKWSKLELEKAKNDKNFRHPKQSGKFLINDIIGRMGISDPELLMEIINNKILTKSTDLLLGFSKYGSVTGHIIDAGGDRQKSHVDYPIHIGSGPFWENSVNKCKNLTTSYQLNNILPYYSVQVLIAICDMDINNGSTEVIPGSHLIQDVDLSLHDPEIYKYLEKYFINVKLKKGDFLIFNRRLCHRGGKNISLNPRNSLILQCIWLWGVGQEIIEFLKIIDNIKGTNNYKKLSESARENLLLRMKSPYPINVKDTT